MIQALRSIYRDDLPIDMSGFFAGEECHHVGVVFFFRHAFIRDQFHHAIQVQLAFFVETLHILDLTLVMPLSANFGLEDVTNLFERQVGTGKNWCPFVMNRLSLQSARHAGLRQDDHIYRGPDLPDSLVDEPVM